ncbi:class I SAM-dependent methyltransferase [Novosphingobium resinovorum]|uniref:class I SAM-dependent methyltransferase n=1 Tax=Novosphingobium resinovorum TaxID=158500 RepID=UPI002ED529AA|nr:methyltransferase domain-containing protein [Novosphingobium resinovorum]
MSTAPVTTPYRVSDWDGETGARWVAHQVRLDAMLAPFGDAALDAADPRPGERVLDVGCGAGASSVDLAARVGGEGRVLGLDISQALVERARIVAAGVPGTEFAVADAAEAALPEAAYDLLFSRFGLMFFADPVAALANLGKALRPGGRLVFVCWRAAGLNDWVRLPMGAIAGIVPPSPPPDPEAPGPFSFGERARVERILAAAGFDRIAMTPLDHAIPFGQGASREEAVEDAVAMAFDVGPLSRALAHASPQVRGRAAEAVHAAFAARPGEHSVMIDGAAWIVTARRPG